MKYPAINVTLPPEVYKALASRVCGSRERSATVARDLDRLYTMYRNALRKIPLTTNEACMMCHALKGANINANSASTLWAEVADGVRLYGLAEKWGVDGEALICRLKDLDPLTCLALVDACERVWVAASDSAEEIPTLVKRFFYCQENADQA